VLAGRIGVVDDARSRLHVRAIARENDGANGDARVEIAGEAEIGDRSAVRTAACRLEAVDQLHGPNLGRPCERAGGKTGEKEIDGRVLFAQTATDIGDQVHHVAVSLDVAELRHLDGAAAADAPEVVAAEVDEHEVLGVFFWIGEESRFELRVFFRRPAAGKRPGDRTRLGDIALDAHEHLRRRTDQRALRCAQQEHVRRWIDGAKRAVERQRLRGWIRRIPALRENDLVDLAGGDLLLCRGDHRLVRLGIHARSELDGRNVRSERQQIDRSGTKLFESAIEAGIGISE